LTALSNASSLIEACLPLPRREEKDEMVRRKS
jgi:hypothetical protein